MKTRYMLLLIVLCLLPGILQAQNFLRGPESVAYDSIRNRYLVSNYTNGRIIEIDSNGIQDTLVTGLVHCFGNCIIDDIFYVSTNTTVIGYELATMDTVLFVTLTPTINLDGMAADTSGYLYVLETGGHIYRIDLQTQAATTLVNSDLTTHTQDMIFDPVNNRLLSVGYAENAPIQAIRLSDGAVTTALPTTLGYFDGIAIDPFGNLYLSSHFDDGGIYKCNRFLSSPPELVYSDIDQPAGPDFNAIHGILAVPDFSMNRVVFIEIEGGIEFLGKQLIDDGDADGHPENGESVDVIFNVINTSSDPLSGLTVSLAFDDATVPVTTGEVYMGDIAPYDSVENSLSPLAFSVPIDYNPRIDTMYLMFSYNAGTVDTFAFQQVIGDTRVVIIDDDDGGDREWYYSSRLEYLRIPYDIVAAIPTPDAADLLAYDAIIWLTGDYRWPFDAEDITCMTDVFTGGGNLFLTGQGIAAELDLIDQSFLQNSLHCQYQSTGYEPLLYSPGGGQTFCTGDSILIFGGDGADNQTQPDHVSPLNGGIGEFLYSGSGLNGAVSFDGAYRLVFFGFGFEAIPNDDDQFTSRDHVLADILDFFTLQIPGGPPQVSDLAVPGVDVTHVLNHTPDMEWTYSDAGSAPQAYYHIQASTDDDWTVAEAWDSGPVASGASTAAYAGADLIDGQTYFIRVRVHNGTLWSDWTATSIRMNSVPVPASLSPADSLEISDNPPTLTHPPVSDSEGDSLWYTYELYADVALETLVESATDIPATYGEDIEWTISETLTAHNYYFWRVRCRDTFEDGQWTDPAAFVIVPAYVCGDANGDGSVDVGDAVYVINYAFKGGPAPVPVEAGDANGDGACDVGDAVYLVNYVFKGGPAPVCP